MDLSRKLLEVNKDIEFSPVQNKGVLKYMPKTDAGFRVSPIIVPLHSALKECAEFENNSEFLLVNRLGEFHSRTSYRRLWEKSSAKWTRLWEPQRSRNQSKDCEATYWGTLSAPIWLSSVSLRLQPSSLWVILIYPWRSKYIHICRWWIGIFTLRYSNTTKSF